MLSLEDLNKLLEDTINENVKLENELDKYKAKVLPKFEWGDKVYALNIKDKKVVEIVVDEVKINKMGVFYTQYIDEDKVFTCPEIYCFDNLKDAKRKLKEFLLGGV